MAKNERQRKLQTMILCIYPFLKQYKDMNQRLREFQTTIQNYNPESCVDPEILKIFQHKVKRTPHFTHFSRIVHIFSF